MKKSRLLGAACLTIVCLCSSAINAALLFDGGAPDGQSGTRIADINSFVSAADFTTTDTWRLTGAEFWASEDSSFGWNGAINYYIFADGGATPTGQPLAQGSGVSIVKIPDPAADVSSYFGFKYSFEFQNPIPLNSDTTYWLVLNLGVDNPTTSNTQAFWASTAQRFRSGAATSVAPTFPRWKEWATVDLAFQINGAIAPLPESVTIDIKPNKKTENVINLKKKNLKVAILGSIEFDALQVDPATVKFGTFDPDAASPIRFKGQDYNHDGYSDLILTFKLSDTGIVCGVSEATLTGETSTDPVVYIQGANSFTIEGCP